MDGSGAKTTLVNMYTVYADMNGDGIPDAGEGKISGVITLDDQDDLTTVAAVELYSEFNDMRIDSTSTAPGGGTYLFEKLADGNYRVEAYAPWIREDQAAGHRSRGRCGRDRNRTYCSPVAGKITGNVIYADGPGTEGSVAA